MSSMNLRTYEAHYILPPQLLLKSRELTAKTAIDIKLAASSSIECISIPPALLMMAIVPSWASELDSTT